MSRISLVATSADASVTAVLNDMKAPMRKAPNFPTTIAVACGIQCVHDVLQGSHEGPSDSAPARVIRAGDRTSP